MTDITEKFIEDLLVEYPYAIEVGFEVIERQKRVEAGIIDIFGKDKFGKYVIVELKRDKADDVVIGQISRYIGNIKREYNLEIEQLRGIIICREITNRLSFASSIIPNLSLFQFKDIKPKKITPNYWFNCLNCGKINHIEDEPVINKKVYCLRTKLKVQSHNSIEIFLMGIRDSIFSSKREAQVFNSLNSRWEQK